MDWVYSSRTTTKAPARPSSPTPTDVEQMTPLGERRRISFSAWYEGAGQALRGYRTFESMRVPNEILNETYGAIQAAATRDASPEELSAHLKKLSHYAVVLIGDLLRLESELLLEEMKR